MMTLDDDGIREQFTFNLNGFDASVLCGDDDDDDDDVQFVHAL